jgi:nucleotide-binding universal stress UspA family protein
LFEKILVPIDGSSQAHDALIQGLEIAKIHGSEVTILHVITFSEKYIPYMSTEESMPPQESMTPPEWVLEYMENVRKNDEKMLKETLKHAKSVAPNVKITTKLLTGRAADTILAEATKENYDLIVIGCRGLGGFKELMLGSVSRNVVNGAKIPVLIIK